MKKKIKNKSSNKKVINKKITNKKVSLTKSLGELLKDEDGFVSKETILKVGLSTVAALGVAGAMADITSALPNTATHTNAVVPNGTNCIQHTNVTTHTSY